MERFDIDLVSVEYKDQRKHYENIRQALVCGFFMQVAHKEGEKGSYLTVKDNQVCIFMMLSNPTPRVDTTYIGCLAASIMRS